MTKDIINLETPFRLSRSRIFINQFYYPLTIRLMSGPNLGLFDPRFFTIALNQNIIKLEENIIKNILRHELAHYFCFIWYGNDESMHGENFKKTCQRLAFSEEVQKASLKLPEHFKIDLTEEESEKYLHVKSKIQKILALTQSSNIHEAALAQQKAKELMLSGQFNSEEQIGSAAEKKFYLQELVTYKRVQAKENVIYQILCRQMIKSIFHQTKAGTVLLLFGEKIQLECAHYLFDFLNLHLDKIYQEAKQLNPLLKGLVAKNQFYHGVLRGYLEKEKLLKYQNNDEHKNPASNENNALTLENKLIKYQQELESHFNMLYPRLRTTYSKQKQNQAAFLNGISAGKNLTLNKGINSSTSSAPIKTKLLNFLSN